MTTMARRLASFLLALHLQPCYSFTHFHHITPTLRIHSRFDSSYLPTTDSNNLPQSCASSVSSGPSVTLYAKKKSRSSSSSPATGFGGAATESCPCGSGFGYAKCCGKLHQDPMAFATATPSQVVRARYTAYAKRQIDFIMASTHPLNKNFMEDIQHWKKSIEGDCYDNFELTQCQILDEHVVSANEATVKFVAHMIQVDTRGRSAFMETSTFERDAGAHGAWLYREGVIEAPPQ